MDAVSYSKTLYTNVPIKQVQMLLEFRKYKYTVIDNWRYIILGEGKPLVLLPGGFMKADMWFYISQKIKGYKMMIPDSYVKQAIYNLHDAFLKIVEMLKNEGFEKATFIGISAGGGLLQYILSNKPEIVKCAILSHTGVLDPSKVSNIKKTIKIAKYIPEFLLRLKLKKMTMQKYPDSEWKAFSQAFIKEAAKGFTKKGLLFWTESSINNLTNFKIKKWSGPVLILTSNDDKLSHEQSSILIKQYPNANIHSFEKGGHHTVFLYPEEYSNVIIDYLKIHNN